MMRRPFSLRGRSLRFQIVLVLLGLLTSSFLSVAAVTALALRTFLVQQLDDQLAAAGNRFSLSLEHPDAGTGEQLSTVEGQAAGTLGARVLNGQVTSIVVVAHDNDRLAASVQDRSIVAGLAPTARPRTVHFPVIGDYRLAVTRGRDGDVLVTGLPEKPVDDTIARLLVIEASVLAGALLLTGLAASYSVRWSLRPLRTVAATARAVALLPLSTGTASLPERVPIASTETEAGQVADAFNHMLEHVEAALHHRHASEDQLRRFIADASHELRTPVAVIRSHAEYAERSGGRLPASVSESLARITAESDRMGRLVQDLLLLARLDSGRELEHGPVDLTRVVLDAVTDARMIGHDHHWQLDLPEQEVMITGDAHALHQAIANMLANVRMHTPAGTTTTTTLRCESSESSDDHVTVTVADDGPGIDPGVADRIFDRFVRADTARAETDGSGLGLSIVSAIITAHRGTLGVTSRPGQTSFTIRLPR